MGIQNIIATIKSSATLKSLADAGRDNEIADAINAVQTIAVPITVESLRAAAPSTLGAIVQSSAPLAEMEVIASRIRSGDALGVGAWATTLHMLGKMPDAELTSVNQLVAAATVQTSLVDHSQVSAALNPIRPVVDGSPRALPIDWSKA